ncbi:DUF3788 family protein [bacterium]
MSISIFQDPNIEPDDNDLKAQVKKTFPVFEKIIVFTENNFPDVSRQWMYYKNYGWHLRVKSKKRNLFGISPEQGRFLVSFIYGQKATDEALKSDLPEEIKCIIKEGRVCSMGRTVRIQVNQLMKSEIFETIIRIKVKH